MDRHEYDLCVLGAGSAGYAAAVAARSMGKSVALADGTQELAGLCILRGCMPSKTILRSAEVAHLARTADRVGIHIDRVQPDPVAVVARKRRIIADFAQDRIKDIERFQLFRGAPRFVNRGELVVGDDVIRARKFLISTGSVISVPGIPGLRETGFVTSDDVLEMEKLPAKITVLGGGSVACELAQYLVRMGCAVTMVQRSRTVLSREDADVGEALGNALVEDGIELFTGTTVVGVDRVGAKKRILAAQSGRDIAVESDEIFLALGRQPNVDGFGFEAAGVAYSENGVAVNEYLQTSNPDIFAAGDVTGNVELVHVAVYEGQLAARNALGATPKAARYELQRARAVFSDPQVAIAGLTERDCRTSGLTFAVSSYPFKELGKAIVADLTQGFIKLLAAPDGRLLGVVIVGAEAADLIHEAIALLYFKANVRDIMEMPHLHPTLAEIITYPAEELAEMLERELHVVVRP